MFEFCPQAVPQSHPVCLHDCLQAAVWQALNHYAYLDAVFLAERLYAEGIFPAGNAS